LVENELFAVLPIQTCLKPLQGVFPCGLGMNVSLIMLIEMIKCSLWRGELRLLQWPNC